MSRSIAVCFKGSSKEHARLTDVNFLCKMSKAIGKHGSSYSLRHVQNLIRRGKYLIKDNAVDSAENDFGWTASDIKEVMCRLKPKHFRKTELSKNLPGVMIDYYAARKMKGQQVYLHFYVVYDGSEELVVINSFHRFKE